MPDLELTVKQAAGKYGYNSTREGLTMSKKWLWLTIGVVGFVVLVYLAAVCSGPVPEQASAEWLPSQPPVVEEPSPIAPERQFTYRERKERGLLTAEELQNEVALQNIEADISAGRVEHIQHSPPPEDQSYLLQAPASPSYSPVIPPMNEARIMARAQQMQERTQMRKWRYQHGLPTQNPTLWERFLGYADGDPW